MKATEKYFTNKKTNNILENMNLSYDCYRITYLFLETSDQRLEPVLEVNCTVNYKHCTNSHNTFYTLHRHIYRFNSYFFIAITVKIVD